MSGTRIQRARIARGRAGIRARHERRAGTAGYRARAARSRIFAVAEKIHDSGTWAYVNFDRNLSSPDSSKHHVSGILRPFNCMGNIPTAGRAGRPVP